MNSEKFTCRSSREAFSEIGRRLGADAKIVSFKRSSLPGGGTRIEVEARRAESPRQEETGGGGGKNRTRLISLGIGAISVALLAIVIMTTPRESADSSVIGPSEVADAPPPQPEPVRLAVLPLIDLSPDEDNRHLCHGIAEEIINKLVRIKRLKVCARASSFAISRDQLTVADIGKTLNVTKLLDGSLSKSGTRLRVSVQLIDVEDGIQIWSQTFTLDLHDLFKIQDDISLAVAQALRLELGLEEREQLTKRYTKELEADDYFKRGQFIQFSQNASGRLKSIDYFLKAIELDPGFALAHSHLAMSFATSREMLGMPRPEAFRKAEEHIARALELDPNLAEGYIARGLLKIDRDFDIDGAGVDFQRALELKPNLTLGKVGYGWVLLEKNMEEEAVATVEEAVCNDPLSEVANQSLFTLYDCLDRRTDAVEQLRRLLELYPDIEAADRLYFYLALAQEDDEAYREFKKYLEKNEEKEGWREFLPRSDELFAGGGIRAVLRAFVDRFADDIPPWFLIDHYVYLEDVGHAVDVIEAEVNKALVGENTGDLIKMCTLNYNRRYKTLLTDARCASLLDSIKTEIEKHKQVGQ